MFNKMGIRVHLICKKQARYFAMSCHSIVHALNEDKNHERAKEDIKKRTIGLDFAW